MSNAELKQKVKQLGEVLERLQGQFTESLEAAYRDGAIDGYYAKEEDNKGLIDALWAESNTRETINYSNN
jgi:hypothetical protein